MQYIISFRTWENVRNYSDKQKDDPKMSRLKKILTYTNFYLKVVLLP